MSQKKNEIKCFLSPCAPMLPGDRRSWYQYEIEGVNPESVLRGRRVGNEDDVKKMVSKIVARMEGKKCLVHYGFGVGSSESNLRSARRGGHLSRLGGRKNRNPAIEFRI